MSMRMVGPINSGVTAGGAGTSTNNADSPIRITGKVYGIYVKYNDSPPATTDVTIKAKGTSPAAPTYNLLVLTDANTSGWFYPQVQIHDTAGSPIAAEYTPLLVYDYVNVLVAQANDGDSVDVWLMVGDC